MTVMTNTLVEDAKIISGISPIDINATATDGDWVSMKNYANLTIILTFGVSLTGTPAITLQQATTVAGGSEKALGFDWAWKDVGLTGALTKTAVTSDTFSKAATSQQMFVMEVRSEQLDVDGGFDCVQVAIATPGSNATLVSCIYILHSASYGQATPPSAIID